MATQQIIVQEQLENLPILARSALTADIYAPLATLGQLQVHLARSEADIESAQRLRYRVFVEERNLQRQAAGCERADADADAFDAACDHLLVVDTATGGDRVQHIVATCRLLPIVRSQQTGLYSASEFDLAEFLKQHQGVNALELGRSCVAQAYRSRRAMELLWRGVWAYVQQHRIGLLFGCASLPAKDAAQVDAALAYFGEYAAAPAEWGVRALPHLRRAAAQAATIQRSPRAVFAGLPPLLKAYLRLGARVACEAADDKAFETTDVFVALRVSDIAQRYADHYSS